MKTFYRNRIYETLLILSEEILHAQTSPKEMEREDFQIHYRQKRQKIFAQSCDMLEESQQALINGLQLFIKLDETGQTKEIIEQAANMCSQAIETAENTTETEQHFNEQSQTKLSKKLSEAFATFQYENLQLFYRLAQTEYEKNNFQKAYYMFNAITIFYSEYAMGWIGLALSSWKLHGPEAAKAIYDMARGCMEHPEIHLYAGDFYWQTDDKDKATEILKQGLTMCQEDSLYEDLIPQFKSFPGIE